MGSPPPPTFCTWLVVGHTPATAGRLLDCFWISPIKDPTGKVVGGSKIIRDISERKQAEMALANAKAELEHANQHLESRVQERTAQLQEMVSELQHVSYAMVHDMRAPLRAMRAFADILSNDAAETPPEQQREYFQRIMAGAQRLDELVQGALQYTRAVLQDLPLQPVKLGPLLRGIVSTYPNLDSACLSGTDYARSVVTKKTAVCIYASIPTNSGRRRRKD